MSTDAVERPPTPNIFARLAKATRYAITGASPDAWFGPQQPLGPVAPPEVKGRQFDYAFGANLNYNPRSEGGVSFAELRALADALPLLRAVIETRKDQIAAQNFTVRQRWRADRPDASPRIDAALRFLSRPDRGRSFADWLRVLIEDLLVIDAATIYPRYTRSGALYSLDVIDGATIKPLIGDDGRAPQAPDPAYQQILHGMPAADFSADELLYLPRNGRAHKIYGMSPVEQIALTINIALRRDAATLEYYRAGSLPNAFGTVNKEWTPDQIRDFENNYHAKMSGNLPRRGMLKFMPGDFRLIEYRQPPLKDQYDEWLARLICYAFSVPATPFVSQVNRATSETMRLQATQEGLVPLKNWIKSALDHIIQVCMGEPDLEFVWAGDDAIDPLQQAQTLNILVSAGIKTREEARAELGLGGDGAKAGLGKFNPNHDEQGRFSTADNTAAVVGSLARKPRPRGVQVASNEAVISDVSGSEVAQIIEPEPPVEPPESRRPAEAPTKETASSVTPPSGTESAAAETSPSEANSADEDTESESTTPRFANGDLLSEHFGWHRYDFDARTESEYEELAASFLADKNNPDILELRRLNGDLVRFNPRTDEFGVLSGEGDIRTYYRVDPKSHSYPTNLDYFQAQKGGAR
jgi:Phage portal protein